MNRNRVAVLKKQFDGRDKLAFSGIKFRNDLTVHRTTISQTLQKSKWSDLAVNSSKRPPHVRDPLPHWHLRPDVVVSRFT
ncbi:MAG: hypothetical protein ACLPT4_17165 [Verrucomicrobiia bacterium]